MKQDALLITVMDTSNDVDKNSRHIIHDYIKEQESLLEEKYEFVSRTYLGYCDTCKKYDSLSGLCSERWLFSGVLMSSGLLKAYELAFKAKADRDVYVILASDGYNDESDNGFTVELLNVLIRMGCQVTFLRAGRDYKSDICDAVKTIEGLNYVEIKGE